MVSCATSFVDADLIVIVIARGAPPPEDGALPPPDVADAPSFAAEVEDVDAAGVIGVYSALESIGFRSAYMVLTSLPVELHHALIRAHGRRAEQLEAGGDGGDVVAVHWNGE